MKNILFVLITIFIFSGCNAASEIVAPDRNQYYTPTPAETSMAYPLPAPPSMQIHVSAIKEPFPENHYVFRWCAEIIGGAIPQGWTALVLKGASGYFEILDIRYGMTKCSHQGSDAYHFDTKNYPEGLHMFEVWYFDKGGELISKGNIDFYIFP